MLWNNILVENYILLKMFIIKNGNKQDNKIENLELWVTKQPKGQRPQDLIEYTKWILKTYST